MRSTRRFAAIVASLSMAVTLASSSAAVEPVVNSAAASPRLKYLPADAWLVGECNVGAIMQIFNTPEAAQNPQFAQFKQAMQMITMMTGIDPERQISHVTFFGAGDPLNNPPGFLVIQGSFDNAAVEPRIAGMAGGAAPEMYKNRALHGTPNGEDLLSFPEPSTMVFGDAPLVRNAIDALDGAVTAMPPSVQNVLDRTPADSVVWVAITPRKVLEQPHIIQNSPHPELHQQLAKLDCASLYFSLSGDGLLVRSLGYVEQSGGAAELGNYLQSRKDDILHQSGSNVVFTSLLVLSEIASSGEHVEGSLRLTAAAMEELWNTRVIVKP